MPAATTTASHARRGQRPPMPGAPPRPRRRVAPGVALPVLAAVLAAVTTLAAFHQIKQTVRVAVAASEIRAGTAVQPDAFGFEDVNVPSAMRTQLLPATDADSVAGWIATHTIAQGAPILRGDLVRPAAANQLRVMSIPVEKSHAAAGEISAGDRVDVIDSQSGRPVYAVAGALVTGVAADDSGGLAGTGDWTVSVAVDDQAALRLADAIQGAKFEVVRSTGARTPRSGTAGGRGATGGGGVPTPGGADQSQAAPGG